jgi:DNA-binding NtrC family response regulator
VSHKIKILIVEDDSLIQGSLVAILESEGYETFVASTAKKAQEMTNNDFFNLILLDVGLPDMTGIELSKNIRDTTPRMRKILLTGYSNGQLDDESIKKYADEYIVKPFDPDKLLDIILRNLKEQEKELLNIQEKVSNYVCTRVKEINDEHKAEPI